MAGYSGTPLPQKLGIKPQARVAFVELPAAVRKALKAAVSECHIEDDETGALDFAMAFVKLREALWRVMILWRSGANCVLID